MNRDDILGVLEKNALANEGKQEEDNDLLHEFDVPFEELKQAVMVDVIDTFEQVLGVTNPEAGPVGVLSTEMLGSILAAHSTLWFLAGLRVARERGGEA